MTFARKTKGRHNDAFNEQQKCHVTNIYTVEKKTKVSYYILLREKQKYHITSRSSKLS